MTSYPVMAGSFVCAMSGITPLLHHPVLNRTLPMSYLVLHFHRGGGDVTSCDVIPPARFTNRTPLSILLTIINVWIICVYCVSCRVLHHSPSTSSSITPYPSYVISGIDRGRGDDTTCDVIPPARFTDRTPVSILLTIMNVWVIYVYYCLPQAASWLKIPETTKSSATTITSC